MSGVSFSIVAIPLSGQCVRIVVTIRGALSCIAQNVFGRILTAASRRWILVWCWR
jgi:hypothetical protein